MHRPLCALLLGATLICLLWLWAPDATAQDAPPPASPTSTPMPSQLLAQAKVSTLDHRPSITATYTARNVSGTVYQLPAPVWEFGPARHEPAADEPTAAVLSPMAVSGWQIILSESFEGAFPPAGWSLFDTSNDGFERLWSRATAQSFQGAWSVWPAGGGADALNPFVNPYANNLDSWMVYGPIDLSDATNALVHFWLWRATEPGFDYLAVSVSADGVNFDEHGRWDGSEPWAFYTVNLDANLGDNTVWVAWHFHSDGSVTDAGAFVDDIEIVKFGEPCTQVAGSYTCTIPAATGWETTPLTLQQGQQFTVLYDSGSWTVDRFSLSYVGPHGYLPEEDTQIFAGCKVDTAQPYAMLLGQVGNGALFPIGLGGTFSADADGTLSLRINDQDGCLGDNDGSIQVAVSSVTELVDLEVTTIEVWTEPICEGQDAEFFSFIRNNSVNASGRFDIRWDADGQFFFGGHESIPGGATDTHGRIWQNIARGQHTLTFIADDGDQIAESNEDNNEYTLSFLAIDCTPEPSVVRFSSSTYTAQENEDIATIEVLLSKAAATAVTIMYETAGGTATAGADYTATSGTLTFGPGETAKSFSIPLLNDMLDEEDETINLTLSSPGQAELGIPASAVLTIVDNEPPPNVQFSAANYSIVESDGMAVITVVLDTPSGKTIQVNYATSNGTATADNDYTAMNGLLTFNPSEITKSFTVPITDDTLDEPDETVNLALSNPVNATHGASTNATLTIIDNDLPPVPKAVFTGAPTSGVKPLTVTFSEQSIGTATSWAWSFGDGGTSNQRNPTYTYNHAGSFTVALTVSGPGGSDSETKTSYIQVSEPLPATPQINAIANVGLDDVYTISWSNSANATGYTVQEQHNGGSWSTIHTGAALTVNLTDQADGDWCYRVRATNAAGDSAWSDPKCTTVNTSSRPQLTMAAAVNGAPGGLVALTLSYDAQGHDVSSLLFSIDYDEQHLSFNPIDVDSNCAPDAIQFSTTLPTSFVKCADVDSTDTDSEIDIRIADFSATPHPLPSGPLLTIIFFVRPNAVVDSLASVQITLASFGNAQGEINGRTIPGSVRVLGVPATLEMTSSSNSLPADGASTTTIPIRILDAAGRGVPGYLVTFATTLGTVTTAHTTDTTGRTSATLTAATTAGVATVMANAGDVQDTISVQFMAIDESSSIFLPLIRR